MVAEFMYADASAGHKNNQKGADTLKENGSSMILMRQQEPKRSKMCRNL